MFNKVFVEHKYKDHPKAQHIIKQIKFDEVVEINKIEDIWGKVKKPYLQKRESLNLFLGEKKGKLVKEAPAAYGHGSEKHYYFIHAYNCIYECQYCYLQGYFNTPDLVLFLNHSDIIDEMEAIINTKGNEDAWFHAGEYSDSLALSHLTNELPEYYSLFKRYPNAKLELRTKSSNIRSLLELEPLPNVYVSFTLSSTDAAKAFDYKCPSVKARIKSIEKLVCAGHRIGIHLDPIIYQEDFLINYEGLLQELKKVLPDNQLGYISLGVVRFTKDVYREVQNNYPNSPITKQDYIKSFDNKIRYNRSMRMWILNNTKKLCLNSGYDEDKIYFCMEE